MDKEYYIIEYIYKKQIIDFKQNKYVEQNFKQYIGEIMDNIEKLIQEIIRYLISISHIGKTECEGNYYGFNVLDIIKIKTWDQLIEFINENDIHKTYKKIWNINLVNFTKDDYIVLYKYPNKPSEYSYYIGQISSNLENLIQEVIRYLIWGTDVGNKIGIMYSSINYMVIDLEKYGFNESNISKIKTWDELINFIIENDHYKNDTSNCWKYPNRWDIELISGNELCK